ncbi:hypothetical protein SAMN04515624_14815 [Eubacterium maltosivorans]|uniref:hypothetical protein n=1 Tax=Eubacterium maltosivorans TaxID=2041044 RepID=UPI00088CB61F|nr:hypothetical protein [Eubacterium maltosivorans]WPK78845.1 hypothetical protein EUMA32_02400 [Eubacterium maltosivorans]SDP87274.1 hypothetical protein SAMN04515624_14815 [Eubacterium maltosivorans]
MKKNNMLLVGFTVQGLDMRYGSVMEDFTAEVVSGSIIDTEYHLICKYRKMGFELTSIIREEIFEFNPVSLHHFFKSGNFKDLGVIQK